MRELLDLVQPVMKHAPNAPEALVLSNLREATTEFCRRTRCWRHVHTQTLDGTEEGIVVAADGAIIFEVETVWLGDRKLTPKPYGEIEPSYFVTGSNVRGAPMWFTQAKPQEIMIVPAGPGELRVLLFLQPAPDGDVIPDEVYDLFWNTLVAGAAARTLLTNGQPFYSPELASVQQSIFETGCNRNFNFQVKGQHRGRSRSRASWC